MQLEARATEGLPMWRPEGEPADATDIAVALSECGSDVVIDLTTYAPHDTSDLSNLVGGLRRYLNEGGHPVLLCPRAGTRLLLESTGIGRVVPMVSTIDQLPKR